MDLQSPQRTQAAGVKQAEAVQGTQPTPDTAAETAQARQSVQSVSVHVIASFCHV